MEDKMKNNRFPANAIRICIDSLNHEDLQGRVYSRLLKQPLRFGNCGEMLLYTDWMFEEKGFPQAFQQKRCFSGQRKRGSYCARPELRLDDSSIEVQSGTYDTFDVIVQTRYRCGWQGLIKDRFTGWRRFRSEKELLEYVTVQSKLKYAAGA
jgi:hypothetical protein